MADITTDLPRWCAPTTSYCLKVCQWLLLAVLACCGCWVAVDQATAKDRCQTTIGRLAVHMKLDSYYSNCQCMTHSLDFSDACNAIYGVVLKLI
jgi:hypothetical protein